MKKTIYILLLPIFSGSAFGAGPWWEQETICRLDPTNCYTNMGIGYDAGMWDATAECWGLKMICPAALHSAEREPIAVGRNDINRGTNINQDFDTDILNSSEGCFGMRKTKSNGTMASVNGKFVNVWCPGVLHNPSEQLPNGEITYGTQPTCSQLAADRYVAVLNNRCYGTYYDEAKYFIECDGSTDMLPSRLIVLNGADYNSGGNSPVDKNAADDLFERMVSVSKNQRSIYYKN